MPGPGPTSSFAASGLGRRAKPGRRRRPPASTLSVARSRGFVPHRVVFEHGLQDSLKYHISSQEFTNYESMLNSLLKSEKVRAGMMEDRKRKARPFKTPMEMTQARTGMTSNPRKQQRGKPTGRYRPKEGGYSRTLTCYKCRGNHLKKDCPQSNIECYYCGEPNHLRSECPRRHLSKEAARAQFQRQQNTRPQDTSNKGKGMLQAGKPNDG